MSLDFLHVNYNFPDAVKLNEIMLRQFPPDEQMQLDEKLELQAKGEVELWAFYDNKELIGFATLRTTPEMIYLFFLAFDDPFQGKGYGKEAVHRIGSMYADRAFTVDFELVNEAAENNIQRIRRRKFYLNCGFSETGWGLEYLGVRYEIFCINKSFNIGQFKEMLDKLPIYNFYPAYFRIL